MSLFPRLKTWTSTEDVTNTDLNAEFDNIIDHLAPAYIDDYSANVSQMQSTTDPGEVGTESLATTLAEEVKRIRFMLREITGKTNWYESPIASLAGLSNVTGTGLTDNRLVSGRTLTTSVQPAFLVPNGAARTVKVDGTPTPFIYYIDGIEYSILTDVTLTGLTAAPSSNNTCLINDANASGQYWTKYMGEDGSEIPVDTMGSEISALVGKFAAFKIGAEYFLAYVKSSTALSKARRGYFFDSTDAALPAVAYSNNDSITLLKLTWVFAKTDGTLTATYNNPVWSADEPTSPAIGDYWYDLVNETWKTYSVGSFSAANAILVGVCAQDTTNTVIARSHEFFESYSSLNTVEVFAESNSQVKARYQGSNISVFGSVIKFDRNIITWDMTLDLDSGVVEGASTYYYFYITQTGDVKISDRKPHDRREDLQGYYHPSQSWRCVGYAFNNASSNLTEAESYYRSQNTVPVRSIAAVDLIQSRDRQIILSGASYAPLLPPSATVKGTIFEIVHNGTSLTQLYTITGAYGTELIGTANTFVMHTTGERLRILADGTGYLILNHQAIVGPTSYTMVLGGSGGDPTPATTKTFSFAWSRIANRMFIDGNYFHASATGATNGTGTVTYSIPTGALIDTTYLTADTALAAKGFVGSGDLLATGGIGAKLGIRVYDTGKLQAIYTNASTGGAQLTYAAVGYNVAVYQFSFQVSFTVSGWNP
jgi:hypothetical protein